MDQIYNNRSLFSDYYLEKLAAEDSHWQSLKKNARELRQRIANILEKAVPGINGDTPEAEVERRVIRPVLDALGHIYFVQPAVPSPEGIRRPDYAFFPSVEAIQEAESHKGQLEFFKTALAVGDAKAWERSLDKRFKGPGDPFTNHNPSYQIDFYLRATDRRWGLLTNGRHWRLYHRDLSYRLDVYYEVDLPEIVTLDENAFLYFLAFFHKEAFQPDGTGECFLDRAYRASTEYAAKVSEELKDNVYEALRLLAEGFLSFPANNLKPQDLDLVRENAFIVIYRLLFILYAEAREFLPVANPTYRDTYSLRALSHDIVTKEPFESKLSPVTIGYWTRLKDLFALINGGDDFLQIPPYNGRLFANEKEHPNLAIWKIGDRYLAAAIDQLARARAAGRTGRGFVSYRDLSIRELGSIYEGLLEHRPRYATQSVAVVKEDKRERFIPLTELGNRKAVKTYPAGSVYLETDKGERKATGSYYTPDYIVKYIVSNTLGPLLEEAKKSKANLIDAILSLKVLDPAMGSGHFLVEATDFLARALVEALGVDPREMEEDEIRWARREVVERCIYGVDLNPLAVDLAKLSLWLSTVSLDKPLNFLDHHLRCGNSLIGARVKDLGALPGKSLKMKRMGKKAPEIRPFTLWEGWFIQNVATAVDNYFCIATLSSDTLKLVKDKEQLYEAGRQALRRYFQVAHIWTSTYFGNEVDPQDYENLLSNIRAPEPEWAELEKQPWFARGVKIGEERHFFHWELEFPEVFFDRNGQRLANAGFYVAVGNPPYDVIAGKEQNIEVEPDKNFYGRSEHLEPALGEKLNYYRLFSTLSIWLIRRMGSHGFIVPMALIGDAQAKPLRKHIMTNTQLLAIEAFPQKDDPKDRVFEDAKLSTCVYVLRKQKPIEPFVLRIHPGKFILDTSPQTKLTRKEIELLDSHGLSIPSMPGTTAEHIVLGISLAKHSSGHCFGEIAPSQQGEVNLTTHSIFLSNSQVGPEVLRGAHVDRYQLNEEPKQGTPAYLRVAEFLRDRRQNSKAFDHQDRRIGYQRGAAIDNWRRIIACVIEPGNFCSDTVNYIVRPKADFYFVLGLLNSSLYEWRFRLTSTNNHVNSYEVDALPLRRINFTTPKAERERLVAEAKRLYYEGLEKAGLNGGDKK